MNVADSNTNEKWTTIIQPADSWFNLNLSEVWRYRDLIFLLVRRDFVSIYKQTVLGPLWFLLQPLFSTVVFTVVFGQIAQIPTEGLPQILFYMSGIITWNYFSSCLTKTAGTFVSNASIFGKVYFPRLVMPISVVLTNLFTFSIQFLLFLAFMCYFYLQGANVHPNVWIFTMPLLLLQMAALGLGFGIIVSSLTTKYRDLTHLVGFGVQLWMYATPIVYPLSAVPEKWQWLIALNPMSIIVETFRYAFLGGVPLQFWHMWLSLMVTVLVLIVGIMLFSKVEKNFMDTV